MFQPWCMPTIAPEILPLPIALIMYCLVGSLGSPLMLSLGLRGGTNRVPLASPTMKHKKAKQVASRQQARHKGLYDRRCKGAALGIGNLVLVKKTAWKGRHKIQDRWESDEYQVIGQPTPGIPVYEVKCIAGGKTRVLHCNLLLPLQGRIRQQEGQAVEDLLCPEE